MPAARLSTSLWLFGYGSLIWRPNFAFVRYHTGFIDGWERRFWQESPDHRGTPEAPGRVVTLLRVPGARCWGRVYEVAPDDAPEIMRALDGREQAGYTRELVTVHCGGGKQIERAITYVAHAGNAHFAGPASEEAIAAHIKSCHGPSGSNAEYLLRLADALEVMQAEDPHVYRLADLVRGEVAPVPPAE